MSGETNTQQDKLRVGQVVSDPPGLAHKANQV